MTTINAGIITREWPPDIYGGAGVHVLELTQALRAIKDIKVDVHCFGGKRHDAFGYGIPAEFNEANPALQALATGLEIASHLDNYDLVHSHTWYTNLAGHVASLQHDIPHIVSAHSLEPLRPWKAEQLGGGYKISSWAEKTACEAADAIIAVSDAMRADLLKTYPAVDPAKVVTIHNGVDTNKFAPNHDESIPASFGIRRPYALFVGRITRQKGLTHLLRAWKEVPPEFGLTIAAGRPDEEGVSSEVAALIAELQSTRSNVWWIREMLPHSDDKLAAIYTAADLSICPSIYEPLGMVNLEAMGCETAVLGSRVGGIPEVVADKETGELIDYHGEAAPFEKALTESITRLMSQPELLKKYGIAGRIRAQKLFGWDDVAALTADLYRRVVGSTTAKA